MNSQDLLNELKKQADPQKALLLSRYFKTGKGEYGEGDQFLGLTVPQSRVIARRFRNLPLKQAENLLHSQLHEQRLIVLLILVDRFNKAKPSEQKQIYNFYLANTLWINNWDLVDSSAGYIVGTFLLGKDTAILTKLAHSHNIWDRRIAIMSTFAFIKAGDPTETLKIAEILLHDQHDLIQKATGWMLREVGKRIDQGIEEDWLKKDDHYKTMPRTSLRYAIERFSADKRKLYLAGKA